MHSFDFRPVYFARDPKGEPVEAIPAGFRIGEGVNGVVFEVAVVERKK